MIAEKLVQTYKVSFDQNNQELALAGSMRPQRAAEMADCVKLLETSLA